jgi:hypothetical protein
MLISTAGNYRAQDGILHSEPQTQFSGFYYMHVLSPKIIDRHYVTASLLRKLPFSI